MVIWGMVYYCFNHITHNYYQSLFPFTIILAGGAITILKNDGVRQWVWDDIPYMKWKIIHSCLKPPSRIGIQ